MVVNDNACELDKRGALESIASRLALQVPGNLFCLRTLARCLPRHGEISV